MQPSLAVINAGFEVAQTCIHGQILPLPRGVTLGFLHHPTSFSGPSSPQK